MKTDEHNALDMLVADHKHVKGMFKQFDALSERSVATKKRLADEICHELFIHMQLEEELFYPAVEQALSSTSIIEEAFVEHASAKELMTQILGMEPGEHYYDARLKVLSEQIEHHINEEETDMFPKVRRSKLDLLALGAQMAELKEQLTATH